MGMDRDAYLLLCSVETVIALVRRDESIMKLDADPFKNGFYRLVVAALIRSVTCYDRRY